MKTAGGIWILDRTTAPPESLYSPLFSDFSVKNFDSLSAIRSALSDETSTPSIIIVNLESFEDQPFHIAELVSWIFSFVFGGEPRVLILAKNQKLISSDLSAFKVLKDRVRFLTEPIQATTVGSAVVQMFKGYSDDQRGLDVKIGAKRISNLTQREHRMLSLFIGGSPVRAEQICGSVGIEKLSRMHVDLFALRSKLRPHGLDIHHLRGLYRLVNLRADL